MSIEIEIKIKSDGMGWDGKRYMNSDFIATNAVNVKVESFKLE